MQIGCLGDIAFQVSADTARTISDMTWSGSANYATHSRHLTDALVEFTGLAPDAISFDVTLSAYLGVSPMADVVKIWEYERSGRLCLGQKPTGNTDGLSNPTRSKCRHLMDTEI